MNPASTATARGASHRPAVSLDPAAEVERLRALIEKQPSCLLRVGTDGTLLAVSDAALSLLGARELAQVLLTNFVERLRGETSKLWVDFVERVSQSGSASTECEMTDLTGAQRAVLLLGVALADHPDGLASVLVSVRDISTARRLEVSLQDQEGLSRTGEEQRSNLASALDEANAKLQQAQASLEEQERLRHRIEEERTTLASALDEAKAQLQPVQASLQQQEGLRRTIEEERTHLAHALQEATANLQQVQASLQDQEGRRRTIEQERTTLATALDDATANLQQVQARLDAAIAEKDQLHAAFDEAVAQRQQIAELIEQLTRALVVAMDAASIAKQALSKETT